MKDSKWFTDEYYYEGGKKDFFIEYAGYFGTLEDYGDQEGPQTEEEWIDIILNDCETQEEKICKEGVNWILEALEEAGYVKSGE